MEKISSPHPCPNTVTIRRNPHRRARPTPSTSVPKPLPSPSNKISHDIPSFPIDDILSIEIPQNPKPDVLTQESSCSSRIEPLPESLKIFLRIRPLTMQQSSGKHAKNGNQTSRSKNVWPKNPVNIKNTKTKPKKNTETCFTINDSHSVTLCPPPALRDIKRTKSEVYEGFSHVFSAESSQNEVYEKMVHPLVEDFLCGKSGMLAALGSSGTGKTHTVFGSPRDPGMVPLALRGIFSSAEGTRSSKMFYLSMFEICSERGKAERIVDLSRDGGDLAMHQSNIKGLQEVIVHDVQEAESFIACGMLKRATAMTNSNIQSSRSQCIVNIRSGPNKINEADDQSNGAVLTIVDLAGAEREKRTGNQGARLLESNFINNTSMVFGLCLRSLLEHQKNPKKPLHKHFQSSMLTRYLRDYLEGKKRMALILTVKSTEEDYLDTSFLLRQASPYMKIKFNNVEEVGNPNMNKRHIKKNPRTEQLKRIKITKLEASPMDGGKSEDHLSNEEEVAIDDKEARSKKVSVQSPSVITPKVNNGASPVEDPIESAKIDRKNRTMQNFAKALWNVLKQYKQKLQVAENEIENLRECLTNEKVRYSELQRKLKDLRSCACCGSDTSVGIPLVEVNESVANPCSDLEGPCYTQEISGEMSSSDDKGSSQIKDESCSTMVESSSLALSSCVDVECVEELCSQTHDFDKSDVLKHSHVEKCTPSNDERISLSPTVSKCLNNDEISDAIVSSSDTCVGVKDLEGPCNKPVDKKDECSLEIVVLVDYLETLKDMGRENVHSTVETKGPSDCMIISSPLVDASRGDSPCSVKVEQSLREDDKKCCDADDAPDVLPKNASSCKPIAAEKPKRRLLPASSILLKEGSGLDIDDDTKKPKGARGEKKLAADETQRTQGSMSLLHLLKTNLRL